MKPEEPMKEHIETVRRWLVSTHFAYRHLGIDTPRAALAKIEAEHERVTQDWLTFDGQRTLRAVERDVAIEERDDLHARVEQLEGALRKIAESRNGMIPSHTEEVRYFGESRVVQRYDSVNKVATAALAAPEQKEPAQPPAPTWAEVRKVLEPFAQWASSPSCTTEQWIRLNVAMVAAAALLSRIPEGE